MMEKKRALTKKEALKALHDSEQRYLDLVQNVNSAIVRWEKDGTIISINEYALHVFGYGEDEVIGRPVTILIPESVPNGRDLSSLVQDIVGHAEHHVQVITENIRRDGSRVWMAWTNKPMLDENGQVTEILSLGNDITISKQAKDLVRESEEKYRQLFDNMSEGFALGEPILDENGKPCDFRFIEVNSAFQRQSGLGRDILGRPMCEILPGLEEHRIETYCEVALSGKSVHFDNYNKDLDRYFRVHCYSPVKGQFAILFWDITKQKKVEQTLRINEERLATVFNKAPFPISLRRERDGTLYDVNEAWIETFGFARTEAIGKTPAELGINHDPDEEVRLHAALQEKGFVRGAEMTGYRTRTNLEPVFLANLEMIEFGGEKYIFTSAQDITERKKAEDALRESRTKLEAALDSMTDAMFISDAEGRFIDFNDAFATFHRFGSKDECPTTLSAYREILDVFTDNGNPAPPDVWAVSRALRGERVTNAEYILRRRDTGESWVGSYSFGPIRDKNGTIVGSVVISRDVTEQKQAEVEFQQALARAEEGDRLLSALMEYVPEGITMANDSLKLIRVSRYGLEMLGMTQENRTLGEVVLKQKVFQADGRTPLTAAGAGRHER